MMKNGMHTKKIMVVLLMSGVITTTPLRATQFTATALLSILITIVQTQSLSFGTIYVNKNITTGNIVLDFNNNATTSSAHVVGSGARTGIFNVSGLTLTPLHASVSNGTLTNGTTTLNMTLGVDQATLNIPLIGLGYAILKVGGTLTVPGTATPGNYSGNYTVTVIY